MRPVRPICLLASILPFCLLTTGQDSSAQPKPPASYEIWVTNQAKDSVQIIDGPTLKVVAEIPIDNDGQSATSKPHTISFSPDGRYAYVANVGVKRNTRNVTIIRAADRKVMAMIPAGPGAHMVLSSPNGSRSFVANAGGSSITEILTDTAEGSFKPGRTFTIEGKDGARSRPTCLAFSSDGEKLYVTHAGNPKADPSTAGFLVVLDVTSGRELLRIMNLDSETCGLERTQDGRKIYFTIGGAVNQFGILDTTTNKIIKQTATGGDDPHGLRITPGGHLVWITNRMSGHLTVLNTTTGIHFKTYFKVGDKPDLLDFSPDGSRVFITLRGQPATIMPNGAFGSEPGLLVFDAETGTALSKIALGGDPHGIAVRTIK